MNPPANPEKRLQRWYRPVAIAIVALLHLAAFNWITAHPAHPVLQSHNEPVVMLQLQREVANPKPAAPPLPKTRPPAVRKLPQPAIPALPVIIAAASDSPVARTDESSVEASATTPAAVIAPPAEPVAPVVASVPEPEPATAPAFNTAPPPSAEVNYAVQALRDGKIVHGSGKIGWRRSGDNYLINGEASVLFFTVLSFQSLGSLDPQGITPLKYSEKRFRKPETNTHFQQASKLISFSASTTTYPRTGGEQDRASIVWQLASIGRGDASQFVPGSALEIFVAGVRDAETWHIKVVGEETLTLGGEQFTTWHFLRQPRPGSYDTQVEFWLAPARDWYPVRLRQTETNGDYLDMSMSSITPLAER
ncbi:DUF3108 domain-containing protein [Actimicrobium sp. CCI2.3]|uniref:DUF3108 domain-containing protein n=1 Tax=Actimicrobium sp. CCI2.3 TaxID=3048616 RepID=UPI002AB58332|nr:DUF3108 domain-containing protein [Actimicrobium sp. CCI2.3]MDY7576327.1 DUF3108 domain-containing protein [Actimicrobium sp. CCI2.3]MEB0020469.1 DUF3108 domain-containing protein [Actimicrobium sp. CCI2.3]